MKKIILKKIISVRTSDGLIMGTGKNSGGKSVDIDKVEITGDPLPKEYARMVGGTLLDGVYTARVEAEAQKVTALKGLDPDNLTLADLKTVVEYLQVF